MIRLMTADLFRLDKRVAIVTGASRGIGRAIALGLAAAGADAGAAGVSRAAVIRLTRVLARGLGPHGIRVNAIAPGLIETRFSEALWTNAESLGQYLTTTPLGRTGKPDEMVGAVLYLAADASSYVTGHTIVLDGGTLT